MHPCQCPATSWQPVIQFSKMETSPFLFITDCFCLLWEMKTIGVPDFPVGLFSGEPMTRPASLLALLPCVGPGNGLDHLCLCLSHVLCGFMCCHINMEHQRWIDIFLAAGRSRSSNQKTDFQSKIFLSSSRQRFGHSWIITRGFKHVLKPRQGHAYFSELELKGFEDS